MTDQIEDALKNMLVLYQRKINERVTARIVQLYQEANIREHRLSQHLALVIDDNKTGRWISLRLSTFRNVLRFISDMGFTKARRLRPDEVRNLQGKEKGKTHHTCKPISKDEVGVSCDWGECNAEAFIERFSTEHGWLPVCRACSTKDTDGGNNG